MPENYNMYVKRFFLMFFLNMTYLQNCNYRGCKIFG